MSNNSEERKTNKEKIMELNKRLMSEGKEPIYHGVKFENIKNLFEGGFLESRTYHRYWKDGLRRKENWKDYKESYWKFGWCLSRSYEVAVNFGFLVFVFDRRSLKNEFKIEPLAWNYHFSDNLPTPKHKKELEEFVVSKKTDICLEDIKRKKVQIEKELPEMYEQYKKMPALTKEDKLARKNFKEKIKESEKYLLVKEHEVLNQVHGKPLDFNKHMVGFFVNERVLEIYESNVGENKDFIELIKNHPKNLGTLDWEQMLGNKKKNKP